MLSMLMDSVVGHARWSCAAVQQSTLSPPDLGSRVLRVDERTVRITHALDGYLSRERRSYQDADPKGLFRRFCHFREEDDPAFDLRGFCCATGCGKIGTRKSPIWSLPRGADSALGGAGAHEA